MSKAFRCWYCTGTGTIDVNDDFERDCGHCGGTGVDGETLRNAAPDLLEAARAVSQTGIDQIMFAAGFDIPPAFAGALRRLDAAIAKAESGDA